MAHTFDTSVLSTNATFDYTCGVGATILFVGIYSYAGARAGANPTFGGKALSLVGLPAFDYGEGSGELWFLQNPSTVDTYSITMGNTGGDSLSLKTWSCKAAAGNTTTYDVSVWVNRTAGAANPSSNIAATADGVIAQMCGHEANNLPSAYTGNFVHPVDHGSHNSWAQYVFPVATATLSVGATQASDEYVLITGAFKQTAAAPLTPTLVTPTNNSTDISINVGLTWQAARSGATAASYIVQVCSSTSFITNDVSVAGVTGTYYGVTPDLSYSTDYWWRVCATNATGNSAFTSANKFTTAALVTTTIKSISNVAYASINKINSIPKASISKVRNVK